MITNKTFSLLLSAATALVLNVLPAQADNHLPAWAFGGFERPEGVNIRAYLYNIYLHVHTQIITYTSHTCKKMDSFPKLIITF